MWPACRYLRTVWLTNSCAPLPPADCSQTPNTAVAGKSKWEAVMKKYAIRIASLGGGIVGILMVGGAGFIRRG